jgi:single-strand DNA-binding protein
MGINKVILIGRLGQDPELRYTPNGTPVATFNIATNYAWTDSKSKEKKTGVDWHRIVAWNKLGEICAEYLVKGRQVYVEGKLKTRSWEKDGHRNYITEVVAVDVQFLSGAGKRDERIETPPAELTDAGEHKDDDIPF